MSPGFLIDDLQASDLAGVLAIQSDAYPPSLVESEEVFRNRLQLESSYCLAAREGPRLLGYLIAHASPSNVPPSLGTMIQASSRADVLFLHDLAVSSAGRGMGVGRQLVERAFAMASRDGLEIAQLIAVAGAAPYWRGLGFVETPASGTLRAKVMGYGPAAQWMTRAISSGDGGL